MTANHVLGLELVTPTGRWCASGGEPGGRGPGPPRPSSWAPRGFWGWRWRSPLRLLPKPEAYHTRPRRLPHPGGRGGEAVSRVIRAGLLPGAMEIMDRLSIEAAEKAVGAGYPLAEGSSSWSWRAPRRRWPPRRRCSTGSWGERGPGGAGGAGEAERQAIWKGRKAAFSAVGRLSPITWSRM